jgi:hypothetical protein
MSFPGSDHGPFGQVSLMSEQHMQHIGAFGSAIMHPIEHRKAKGIRVASALSMGLRNQYFLFCIRVIPSHWSLTYKNISRKTSQGCCSLAYTRVDIAGAFIIPRWESFPSRVCRLWQTLRRDSHFANYPISMEANCVQEESKPREDFSCRSMDLHGFMRVGYIARPGRLVCTNGGMNRFQ